MIRKQKRKLKSPTEAKRYRRRLKIRKTVSGTAERPRVVIFRSAKNISAQVIDDVAGKTLASVQSFGKNGVEAKANKEGAEKVGKALAEKLSSANLKNVVFDRAGYKYHGVIKTFADTLRESGIQL